MGQRGHRRIGNILGKVEPQLERENHLKHARNGSKWDAFGQHCERLHWMKLVKAVTVSKDGGGPPLPKAFIETVPEQTRFIFCSLPADLEARERTKGCSCCS